MKITEVISNKRLGKEHAKEEIEFLVNGLMDGTIADYQVAAWLMAVCFRGLNAQETTYLTESIIKSGDVMDLSDVGGITIDKHSTGGVGDKITLTLIPLLAAAGLKVAKLSGRSLGHTGGTIDKLESIPGFQVALPIDKFLNQVKKIGVAIASQTLKLAPADGKIYALRDVTSTVDNMSLIASSVVSKKIASGADIIILDVKYGNGAFLKTKEESEQLSILMKEVAKRLGKKLICAITSMEEPLGHAVGNSLEVQEAVSFLKGETTANDIKELTLKLAALAMVEAKKADTIEDAEKFLGGIISSGAAYKKFEEIVTNQGGNLSKLPQAPEKLEIKAEKSGVIQKCDALCIAKAAKLLGAGRDRKEDSIDYSVGVTLNKKIGDNVCEGETLATLHHSNKNLSEAEKLAKDAFEISDKKIEKLPLIYKII